eukprot:10611956-Lingulodinium_polyedra.AAC.1
MCIRDSLCPMRLAPVSSSTARCVTRSSSNRCRSSTSRSEQATSTVGRAMGPLPRASGPTISSFPASLPEVAP